MNAIKLALLLSLSAVSACAVLRHATPPSAPAGTAAGAPAKGGATAALKPAFKGEYLVQPGDVLDISVWKEKDLQAEVAVRPDGGINFPLAGEIKASGHTVEQVQSDLTARLSKYVPDPIVTVSVKQSLGYQVYVVGQVNKPGQYATNRVVDVMQALSMAGGLTPFASENNIKILRRLHGRLESIPFEYSDVAKGKELKQDILLQGGDVVVVP